MTKEINLKRFQIPEGRLEDKVVVIGFQHQPETKQLAKKCFKLFRFVECICIPDKIHMSPTEQQQFPALFVNGIHVNEKNIEKFHFIIERIYKLTKKGFDMKTFCKQFGVEGCDEVSVVIFGKSYCPYFKKSVEMTKKYNQQHEFIFDFKKVILPDDFVCHTTTPIIFVCGNYIGGCEEYLTILK